MRRKIPKKRKNTPQLNSYHKRGTNRISIVFPPGKKSLEEIETLLINYDWSPVDRQLKIKKRKLPSGKTAYIPPKAFYVIFKIVKKRNEQYYTQISPVDMVVNIENVQDLTINTLHEIYESWSARKDIIKALQDESEGTPFAYLDKLDMQYLKEIIIHFIYL